MSKKLIIAALIVIFAAAVIFIVFTGTDSKGGDGGETTDVAATSPNGNTAVPEEELYPYDLSEYITMGSFPEVAVEQEAIDNIVKNIEMQAAAAEAVVKDVTDRPVQDGDKVIIDYVGTRDGVAFAGGTANGAELVIGSGKFIPGFEDGLIGYSVGDEVKLNLTFPHDYRPNADLAGASVVFTVKINGIKETVYPELTDAMIATFTNNDYTTLADFRVYITRMATETALWEAYINSCPILKYPEKEVGKYKDQMIANYTKQAQAYGMTLEQMVPYFGYADIASFTAALEDQIKQNVVVEMVICQTARLNEMEIGDEEYKTAGLEVAKKNGAQTLEEFEAMAGKNFITMSIHQKNIIKLLYESYIAE